MIDQLLEFASSFSPEQLISGAYSAAVSLVLWLALYLVQRLFARSSEPKIEYITIAPPKPPSQEAQAILAAINGGVSGLVYSSNSVLYPSTAEGDEVTVQVFTDGEVYVGRTCLELDANDKAFLAEAATTRQEDLIEEAHYQEQNKALAAIMPLQNDREAPDEDETIVNSYEYNQLVQDYNETKELLKNTDISYRNVVKINQGLSDRIDEFLIEEGKLREQVRLLGVRDANYSSETTRLRADVARLSSENTQVKNERTAAAVMNESLRKENANFSLKSRALNTENIQLKEEKDYFKEEVKVLTEDVLHLTTENGALKKESQALKDYLRPCTPIPTPKPVESKEPTSAGPKKPVGYELVNGLFSMKVPPMKLGLNGFCDCEMCRASRVKN